MKNEKREKRKQLVEKNRNLKLVISTAIFCIILLTVSVNGQSPAASSPQSANLPTGTKFIPNQNTTAANSSNSGTFVSINPAFPEVYNPSSSDQQRAVSILESVVDLNLSSYAIILDSEESINYFSLSQNRIEYCLSSEQGSMRVACSFIGNKLHQIYIGDWTGSMSLDQELSTELDSAKSFLQRYKDLTGNAFYGTLRSLLSDAKSNENITRTSGNVNLKITVNGQARVNFIWTYIDQNGIMAQSKNVVLSYNQGRLQSFQDNWDLYRISGTTKVSEEEAIATALNAIQNFVYNVSTSSGEITVSGFQAHVVTDLALSYLNEFDEKARDNDAFTLYPSWYVPLGFDKIYRGGVTGAVVRIWADNGQVSSINPMLYRVDYGANSSTNGVAVSEVSYSYLLSNALLTILIVGIAVSYFMYALLFRRHKFESWKALSLCGLIAFGLLATSVQAVNGYPPNSKAEVYASYREQITQEKTAMQYLTSYIQSNFNSVGYDTARYCGTETSSIVYANIQYDQQNYNRVAVFHFGHMAGAGNYTCSDESEVTYPSVLSYTNGYPNKHFFAVIWVCNSACDSYYYPNVNALAKSWTQRSGMSSDGFNDPDTWHSNCFIGFQHMSPTLTYAIYNTTTITGFSFISKFYYYAITQGGYSVHDALDQASLALFGIPFDETPLLDGCYSYYPGDNIDPENPNPPGDYPCKMKIYGNSNIYLRQYYPYLHEDTIIWGYGSVSNPTNIHGKAPDGAYTGIYGGNYDDGGAVVSIMTGSLGSGGGFSRGHIYLYGYSVSGYYSHLYVYVSKNNYYDWQLAKSLYVYSSTPSWIDIGNAPSEFKYIAVVGIDDQGWSCNLRIDAVRVIP